MSGLWLRGSCARRRVRRRVRQRGRHLSAVAVAAALLVSGCSGGDDTAADTATSGDPSVSTSADASTGAAATTRTPPPPPDAPAIDVCRLLSAAQVALFSDESKGGSCARRHTAYTFAVGAVPADVALPGVNIQNDAVQDAAAASCQSKFRRFIGGNPETRALSRLDSTYFLPTQRDFDRGAHWVRCDIVAYRNSTVLAELPDQSLEGFLDRPRALDSYGVCARGEPGEAKTSLVTCDQDHEFRAVDALRLGTKTTAYPGRSDTLATGSEQCKERISKLLELEGGFVYAYTFPSASDWADGQRFGYCWNKTPD